ncbi:uncharacterized protein Triagg1_6975 [Trichoderma aggressivum f. europaeum]|uniref:Nephrocystin 3-like N-terminal domain-containing protein n=1 Tax=Trichoderma aggressivum f. europaeum TaxID=173218 RepID=A0AAE1IAG3_9HYPO|nr:hypothetical protein Triagg1_6975 [Trichoderma aggressivum f. europaeum]
MLVAAIGTYSVTAIPLAMDNVSRWFRWPKDMPTESQHPSRREQTPQLERSLVTQSKKELTFRVRGVPNDWDRDKLESFLIERDSPAGPVVKSLTKEFHGRSQTATVSFRNTFQLPLRISLPAPYGQFGQLQNLTLDHDFLSITSLFAPAHQNHNVDIVAISGLGGHAFGSFKERDGEHMWLRDALPHSITNESGEPIARIMVYGYESSLPNSDRFQNLEDLGTNLHSDLRTLIFDDSFKPIVFIAHSLGGLIVKQFLISLSKSKDEVDQKLRRAVYGIAFFGVPHDGMDIHSLIPMVGDGPNRFLLESIGSNNSQILSIQQREFSDALGDQGETEIVSFYETRFSPTALQDESGRWTMSGEPAVLVSKASATHCRPCENRPEHICAINRTHSEMVKFAQEDPEYNRVLGRIRSLAQRAITARRSPIQSNMAQEERKYPHFPGPTQPSLSQEERKCLQSLAFRQMHDRGNDIEHAAQGTCEWLLKHDTYISWAASHGGLLWIKGKPGAGKSTLLKYAISKYHDISRASGNALVISFFFHGRGGALQKTPLGFLQSILHQILKKAPEALSDLVGAYQQKCIDMGDPPGKWYWHVKELWGFLELSLPRILTDRSIWLFVDALDECGEADAKQLVQRFKRLLQTSAPRPAWIQFNICFSCRHYPILNAPEMFEIWLEMENNSDISIYVKSELKISFFEQTTPSVIQNLIIGRASGIFLWARLVVKQVQDLELEGFGPNKIEAIIRTIPEDLHELYKTLIHGMGPPSLRLIQWVCFATRPLTTEELRWALVVDAKFSSLQECQKSEDYIPNSERMNQQVIKLSRGLAEVTQRSDTRGYSIQRYDTEGSDTEGLDSQVVQFIHQSVKDFFMNEGLVALDNISASATELIGMAQLELSKTCICYLKMEEISHSVSDESDKLKEKFPFLHYATTSWVLHSQQSDTKGIPQGVLLSLFAWPSNVTFNLWTRIFRDIVGYSEHCPSAKTTLVHIAARYHIVGALKAILEHDDPTFMNIDSKDEDGRTPLSWAVEHRHEGIAQLLLDAGAEVDSTDKAGWIPLLWAVKNGHEAMAKLLLNAGAKVDSTDNKYHRTLLSWAAKHKYEAVVKLLLNAGAEVNSKDTSGWTPLLWAVRNSHETAAKLLLNTGAEVNLADKKSRTPLLWAVENRHEAIAKLLLDAGAEVNLKDKDGWTPLSWAIMHGYKPLIKLLLDAGAEIDFKDTFDGQAPLSWASRNGYETAVKLLLDAGAEVDARDNSDRLAPLSWAVREGHKTVVKLLLNTGAEVDSRNKFNVRTPLSWASENGNEAVVRLLLAAGAEVDSQDNLCRQTPLSWASKEGHETVVKLLLTAGAGVNSQDHNNKTPLSWASEKGHEAVVKILLDAGAGIDDGNPYNNQKPLSLASKNGYEAVVKLLLNAEAKVGSQKRNSNWPLLFASHNGHEAVARLLLDAGAEVNFRDHHNYTSLSLASKNGYEAVVKLLLDAGAEVDSQNHNSNTPLLLASEDGHEVVAKLLLSAGANPNIKGYNFGWTPLLLASQNGHNAIVKLLLTAGAEVDFKDPKDQTPLSLATMNGHENVVKLLLDARAKVDSKDIYNQTPLLRASSGGYKAMVKLLLNAGAEVDYKDQNNRTPLSWASGYGYEPVVKLLLNAGAKVNSKDSYNQTPLLLASTKLHETVIKLLLDAGAEVDFKDHNNRTPLSLASGHGYENVVKMLLDAGAKVGSKDSFNQTPLGWAVTNRHKTVVKLLLDAGVKFNSKDYVNRTPLASTI